MGRYKSVSFAQLSNSATSSMLYTSGSNLCNFGKVRLSQGFFEMSSNMTAFFIAAERFRTMFLIVLGDNGFPVNGDASCKENTHF